jgi:hypothetical protein
VARSERGALVRERVKRKFSDVVRKASTKGEDHRAMAGSNKVEVWRRTSAANRWETDGSAQNLKRVAMDWGSSSWLVRRVMKVAKLCAAFWRKDAAKTSELIGCPKRRKPPLISEFHHQESLSQQRL